MSLQWKKENGVELYHAKVGEFPAAIWQCTPKHSPSFYKFMFVGDLDEAQYETLEAAKAACQVRLTDLIVSAATELGFKVSLP